MKIKPAIGWLNIDSNEMLINNVSVVLKAQTDNIAIYTTPSPPLTEIQLALDDFSTAVHLVNGGPVDTLNRNNLRLVLVNKVRLNAAYVTVACKGSMANLILSGFPPQKTNGQPIGPLPQPQGLTVSHGPQHGQMAVKFNPVFGASIYSYRMTANTPGAVPAVVQDTAANHLFSGLTAGVNYTFEVSASGAAGPSDWSGAISLTAD